VVATLYCNKKTITKTFPSFGHYKENRTQKKVNSNKNNSIFTQLLNLLKARKLLIIGKKYNNMKFPIFSSFT